MDDGPDRFFIKKFKKFKNMWNSDILNYILYYKFAPNSWIIILKLIEKN